MSRRSPWAIISDIFTTPIPGLSNIPGISHITGTHELERIKKDSKVRLDNSRLKEEMKRIDLDIDIFKNADAMDETDRALQKTLFGGAIFNKQTHKFEITKASKPDLQPMLDAFIELEKSKEKIRNELRPAMETQTVFAISLSERVKTASGGIPRDLDRMFASLQNIRLIVFTEREIMMKQRELAYQIVKDLAMRGNAAEKPDPKAPPETPAPTLIEGPMAISEMHEQKLEELATFLTGPEIQKEQEIDRRVKEKELAMKELRQQTEQLKVEIDALREAARKKMTRRQFIRFGALGVAGVAAVGSNEAIKQYQRDLPLSDLVRDHGHMEINPDEQLVSVFKRGYSNPFHERTIKVSAHSAEKDLSENHAKATTRILEGSYRIASGAVNPPVDRIDATLHPMSQHSLATPWLQRSIFVERRSSAVEGALKSTNELHVFNHSVTSDYSFTPGSNSSRNERKLMTSMTNPITIAGGNWTMTGETVTSASQHIGGVSHHPRYSLQIGELEHYPHFDQSATRPGSDFIEKGGVYTANGSHPDPFIVFPIPVVPDKTFPDLEGLEVGGSSMAAPGAAGHLAAIKSIFPTLSWDNVLYAVALGADKRLNRQMGAVSTAKFPNISSCNDLTYSHEAGFGYPDPTLVQKILENMVYQRTLHPEIQHKPTFIDVDPMDSGPASTRHHITLPANKELFKLSLEMVVPANTKGAWVKITDEAKRETKITLVDDQAVSRFTDWSHMTQSGGNLTITSSVPIRLGYVAHFNDKGSISLGVDRLKDLKSTSEIKSSMDRNVLRDLPVSMPVTPEKIMAPGIDR